MKSRTFFFKLYHFLSVLRLVLLANLLLYIDVSVMKSRTFFFKLYHFHNRDVDIAYCYCRCSIHVFSASCGFCVFHFLLESACMD